MGEKQMKKSKIIIITIITILVFVAIAMYLWKRNENSYKIERVTNIKYNLILEKENQYISCDDEWMKPAHHSDHLLEKFQNNLFQVINSKTPI